MTSDTRYFRGVPVVAAGERRGDLVRIATLDGKSVGWAHQDELCYGNNATDAGIDGR